MRPRSTSAVKVHPIPSRSAVALAFRMDPAIERVQHDRGGTPHLHRLGQIAEPVEETAHRDLGGLAAALGAADAVGDRRDHVAARLGQLRAEHGAGEILVAFARAVSEANPTLTLTPEIR